MVMTTVPPPSSSTREQKVNDAVDFILQHSQEPIFPRTIMAAGIQGQVAVSSRDQILAYFKAANYKDCRINAFPRYTSYNGINRQPANFIFIDLDLTNFSNDRVKLDRVKDRTCKNIQKAFGDHIQPTVLWTGGGYHIYLPLSGDIIPEQYDVFAEFADWWRINRNKDLTSVFMGFAKRFFTDGKCDKAHTPTVKSCLLRVPDTMNTKRQAEQEVAIIQPWNGERAAIQYVLRDFRYYLFDNRFKDKIEELKRAKESASEQSRKKKWLHDSNNGGSDITGWIECLLQLGIEDFRKNAVSLIFAPYLLHKKKLSTEQAVQVIRNWLQDKCSPLSRLNFNAEYLTRSALNNSLKKPQIYHMSFDTLAKYNPELHKRLQQEMSHR
jgi:hypothetical protein